MKVKNISQAKLSTLDKMDLESHIMNTEAEILIFDSKDKWDKNKKVYKKIYIDEGEMFNNKIYTVNELIHKKDLIEIEELVLPEKVISVKGKVNGFIMPYIENINLKTVLHSTKFTAKEKLLYLKQIGEILEKMKKERKNEKLSNFYLNDLHTSNFILNKDTSKINVVDLDSCRIGNNMAQPSKYLTERSNIYHISKYKHNPNSIGGIYEIDENTELYCYVLVIFDCLFNGDISKLSIDDYYIYLEYLSSIGVPKEILDKFALIYSGKDNENPYEYLEDLEHFYGRTSSLAFNAVRKRLFI